VSTLGRIGIINHDIVELSNLQRQILHTEHTLSMHKSESATQAIQKYSLHPPHSLISFSHRLNSRVHVDTIAEALSTANAARLLQPYYPILDCTDNVPMHYLLFNTAVALVSTTSSS
jgi:adenylyltransferase/sulfurtransferase